MNIDPKILNKIQTNQIQLIYQRDYIPQLSGIYLNDSRMVQHIQINVLHHTVRIFKMQKKNLTNFNVHA